NRAKSYAAACEQRYGWFLPQVTKADTPRDMVHNSPDLGLKAVKCYGLSYVTSTGQASGTLSPGDAHRMVLDSTVDPTGAWYADNIAQDYAFQGRINAFFAWIAKYEGSYHLGSSGAEVQGSSYKIRAMLAKKPLHGQVGAD